MKNVKWGNKELPGDSQEKLNELSYTKIVASEKALSYSSDPEILKKRGKAISKATKGRVNDMSYLNTKEAKENWRKSIDLDALADRLRENAKKRRKAIDVYKDGVFVKTFESCLAASKELPISLASISNMANPNHPKQEVHGYTVKVAS